MASEPSCSSRRCLQGSFTATKTKFSMLKLYQKSTMEGFSLREVRHQFRPTTIHLVSFVVVEDHTPINHIGHHKHHRTHWREKRSVFSACSL